MSFDIDNFIEATGFYLLPRLSGTDTGYDKCSPVKKIKLLDLNWTN